MRPRFLTRWLLQGALWGPAALALSALPAAAQCVPSCGCPAPVPFTQGMPAPVPGTPAPSQEPPQGTEANPPTPTAEAPPSFAGTRAPGGVGEMLAFKGSPGGYLDDAIPRTQIRLRYDAAFDLNRPDRAEFFYATWKELSFHPHGINGGGVFFDPKARGPENLPGSLDYQELNTYLEYAVNKRLSAFIEAPVRFLDYDNLQEDPDQERKPSASLAPGAGGRFFPEPGPENTGAPHTNRGGFSDLIVGLKAALVAEPDQYLTFQFKTFLPTGDAGHGLGTGHVSLEPGLLLYKRLNDRLEAQGQFLAWIPVGGGPMEGNILIYGAGLGYDLFRCGNRRLVPIVEVVGWTVLNGFESIFGPVATIPPPGVALPTFHGVDDASGDTIIDVKIGARYYFSDRSDVYVGYGRALTGDRWYHDIVRLEYRLAF